MRNDNSILLDEPSLFYVAGECGRSIFKIMVYIDEKFAGEAEVEKGSWFFSYQFKKQKKYELKLYGYYEQNKAVSTRRIFVID